MDYDSPTSPSLKSKIRSSACFSCCFRSSASAAASDDDDDQPPSLLRASSTWLRSKAQDLPEMKHRCQTLISRIGKNHHRRHHSADFRYDPLSYALNFDEGNGEDAECASAAAADDVRYRNFSSRLPASPPPPPPPTVGVAYG